MISSVATKRPFGELTTDEKLNDLDQRLDAILSIFTIIGRELGRPELMTPASPTSSHLRVVR